MNGGLPPPSSAARNPETGTSLVCMGSWPAAMATGGGGTVSPAWCGPESKGTAPGNGSGPCGRSQNEVVPASEGVTMVSMATGCAAVLAVVGGPSLQRPRSPASAVASAREGPGRPDARGGPGTPVVWTSEPAADSRYARFSTTVMGCCVTGTFN